ncbi:DEKNAAC104197 [Brettanomyces naardenensis]|uniref:ubiquitinyl hydrolase 1 n=1 Tax=Brettanomyces naardenensis TaxID=13370 RepID=A0A448YPX1_BRENA|nr:DEKNAAC104197 [Brettanomyces naardenensis]
MDPRSPLSHPPTHNHALNGPRTTAVLRPNTVRSIASQQFDLVESNRISLSEGRDRKARSRDKSDADLVLSWIDISLNYMNILKLLSDGKYFKNGHQSEILIELFCYNYFILHHVLPSLSIGEEDKQMVMLLNQMAEQFEGISDYRDQLHSAVRMCDEILDPKILSPTVLKSTTLKSTPSEYYPADDDDEEEQQDNDHVASITINDLSQLSRSRLLLLDMRSFDDFVRSSFPPGFILSTVNVSPKFVEVSSKFGEILDRMKTANMDSFRRLAGLRTYSYVIYYSENSKVGELEHKIDSLLRDYLQGYFTQILWLDGGWSSLEESKQKVPPTSPYSRPAVLPPPAQEAASSSTRPPIPRGMGVATSQTYPTVGPSTDFPLIRIFNYGSTCYINSMLQCLYCASYFRNLFMNENKFMQILRSEKDSLSLSLHHLFVDFFRAGSYYIVKPARFVRLCSILKPDFNIPYEQQDTSQFLYFIMDKLHSELKIEDTPQNRETFRTGDQETDPFAMYSTRKEYKKWHDSLMKTEGVSPINGLFQIQQETCLTCGRCGYKSFNYDYSSMMHLNLNGREYHLNDLIMKNLTVEELSDRLGNAWKCPSCEKMEKRLLSMENRCRDKVELEPATDSDSSTTRKRSSFFKLRRGDRNKSTRSLDIEHEYPEYRTTLNLDRLDMRERQEYERISTLLSQPNVSYRSTAFIKLPKVLIVYLAKFDLYQKKLNNINLKFPKTLKFKLYRNGEEVSYGYQLSSWIDHLGSSVTSGHYTSVVSRYGKWFYCDDENLSAINYESVNEIGDPNAYLLFYSLKG